MKKKPPSDPKFEVRLQKTRRGSELTQALQTDILPIQSTRGEPRLEIVKKDDGTMRCYVADITRLTGTQINRVAQKLVVKYREIGYGEIDLAEMQRTIQKFGFTVPLDDCELTTHPTTKQASFLERSAPRD